MGPVAFLWPPDRAWGAAQDNTPPCGSQAGVTNRTEFPLTNGAVSLVIQDESYNVNLAIAYINDPTSNDEFETIVSSSNYPELDPGHECYSVPNPPSSVVSGSNATLQLKYVSDFDTDTNETYYACADITYVPLSEFTEDVLCFNVSTEDTEVTTSSVGASGTASSTSSSTAASATTTTTGTSSANSNASQKSRHNGGLSGGAIAGVVVGSVAGAALLALAAVYLWRYRQKKVQRDRVVALRMGDWTNPAKRTASQETPSEAH
ncbi:gpi anchored protein [Phaeomoniella chlamydospora]|uniref:Gpi anchored protein n=1 Tax=Phaeomoniella chlamydospora TaxID=158046 RepID=A0A0G2GKP2_PHACM|nr:gpi anchored protein [Phaeomoniella chlamydospora]